jgi:hypothetical protein
LRAGTAGSSGAPELVDHCLSFCPFLFGHCVVCPLAIVLSVRYTKIVVKYNGLITNNEVFKFNEDRSHSV